MGEAGQKPNLPHGIILRLSSDGGAGVGDLNEQAPHADAGEVGDWTMPLVLMSLVIAGKGRPAQVLVCDPWFQAGNAPARHG
jgi:hypothetical protein